MGVDQTPAAEIVTVAVALPDVLVARHAAQSRLGQTADQKAAVEAFPAKRRPEFHAR